MKVVQHPIADNQLRINNKEYVALDISKVVVGIEVPEQTEIIKNPDTGLNISRTTVEGREIYNAATQKHNNWFILDLETGTRGWYPGCTVLGNITGINVALKAAESSMSSTLVTLSTGDLVTVLNCNTIKEVPKSGWYNIKVLDYVGYIKKENLVNIRYGDPI